MLAINNEEMITYENVFVESKWGRMEYIGFRFARTLAVLFEMV